MGRSLRILLDTHRLIWLVENEEFLSPRARQILRLRSTLVLVSVASLWEMSIKMSRGKLEMDRSLMELIDDELASNGIDLLPITREHILRIEKLSFPMNGHADPFDRMLVAQALANDLEPLSADVKLDGYGVRRVW